MMRDFSKYQRQYRISANPSSDLGQAFLSHRIGDRHLSLHEALSPIILLADGGEEIGWLLGEPIDLDRRALVAGTFDLGRIASLDDVHHRLEALGGWFLAVLRIGDRWFAIPDAGARMPCYYNSRTGELASSPNLLLGEGEFEQDCDHDLLKAVHIEGKGWLPFGLTAIPYIRRLIPNHVLDLHSFEKSRFWPVANPVVSADPAQPVEAIIAATQSALDALIQDGATLALTAGHESRSLLAMLRGRTANVSAMTLAGPAQAVDVAIAARLSAMAGIAHQPLPIVLSSEEDRLAWMERTGWVVGDENPRLYRTHMGLNLQRPVVAGFGGEVARGFFWREHDGREGRISPRALLNRMAMPALPLLEEECGKWLDGVQGFDVFTQLDLAYIEQRLGCWGASPPFGPDYVVRDCHPMVSRRSFANMLRLPIEFRRREKLAATIIEKCWPELARLPFNRLSLFDYYWRRLKKLADPRAVQRKLRKIRG